MSEPEGVNYFDVPPVMSRRRRHVLVAIFIVVLVGLEIAVLPSTLHQVALGNQRAIGHIAFLIVMAAVCVVLAIVLPTQTAATKRGIAAVASRRPGSVVFFTVVTVRQRVPLQESAAVTSGRPPKRIIVSVGSSGIELWTTGAPSAPFFTFRWDDVETIAAGTIQVRFAATILLAPTAFVHLKGDAHVIVPLWFSSPTGSGYVSPVEANAAMAGFARWATVVRG